MTDAGTHAVVIGAGVVGVSTALWLQEAGWRATLVDPRAPGEGASYGNGGVLAASAIAPVTTPGLWRKAPRMLFDPNEPLFLRWAHLPRLAPWLLRYLSHSTPEETRRIAAALYGVVADSLAEHQALAARVGPSAERHLKPSDYLYVYRDRAAYEADHFVWAVRRAHGFEGAPLVGAELRAYDPAFGDAAQFGVRLGGHGRISDPGAYVKALAAHVEASGSAILRAAVDDVVVDNGAVVGVRVGGETLACDAVALCAGAWSKPLAARLGVRVPLESERGYHLELWEPTMELRAPTMIAAGKFVATPMEGRIRLAGIVEFGGLEAPPSKAPFALLRRRLRAAMPTLRWREETEWMGHRPAPADSIPLIGPAPKLRGAYLGFGHHHIGLTAGPKTGRLLAQVIAGRRPNLDLAPYAPARFA